MQNLIVTVLLMACTTFCWANSTDLLSAQRPSVIKNCGTLKIEPTSDIRQGGDTMELALPIENLPFFDFGTTEEYQDDYEFSCPYTSPAPDVIYSYSPNQDQIITIDLCGSQYDTQVFVFDSAFSEVACNSDYYYQSQPCGFLVSRIDNIQVYSGETYFIAVDGYTNDGGNYEIKVWEEGLCELSCPSEISEGEPALFDGYIDQYNGGCGFDSQSIQDFVVNPDGSGIMCGTSGWYRTLNYDFRDRDNFAVFAGSSGQITINLKAEFSMQLFLLSPASCDNYEIVGSGHSLPCEDLEITMNGAAGLGYWVLIVPVGFSSPISLEGQEFSYTLKIEGLEPGQVGTEGITLDVLKARYRSY